MLPMQPGDVKQTYADVRTLKKDYKYLPKTKVSQGIASFVDWYKSYYNIQEL